VNSRKAPNATMRAYTLFDISLRNDSIDDKRIPKRLYGTAGNRESAANISIKIPFYFNYDSSCYDPGVTLFLMSCTIANLRAQSR
jgi:hypothetical protein